jgi:hypothetical protein
MYRELEYGNGTSIYAKGMNQSIKHFRYETYESIGKKNKQRFSVIRYAQTDRRKFPEKILRIIFLFPS